MSTDHSMYSSQYSYDKEKLLVDSVPTRGTHKVKYQPDDDWDFHLDIPDHPIDLSLTLPHYRARYQPVDYRMSMFIGSNSAPVKVKVCRLYPRHRFYLEVQADTSDVTFWLPSDFRGQIHHTGRASFSAGFTNHILQNTRLNESEYTEVPDEDEVVVATRGHITFRMWDVRTQAPEKAQREALKRMFGCVRKAPETAIDWDFLLED
ncbi:hypothetical protein LshimejAT787_0209920 [Lyophyllum shimeji]|uniref:DUF7330 domain-containing protein n=1 Tax=Lyophyllum shimeji TaxID=47721 RepID=A0A9P3UJG1_LYOSH|nr:hypothetical protein LshimejAT787_0209920 [Lyophyllum shimeji]